MEPQKNKLKVAVVGIGGVGGFFGGLLACLDDVDVYFIQRDGVQYRGLKACGLRVRSPPHSWDFTIKPLPLFLGTETASIGACDAVIVCVKSYSMDETLATLKPLLRPAGGSLPPTAVLPLLNGMEAPQQLANALGAEHALGGLCLVLSEIESPGVILSKGNVKMIELGELGGKPGPLAPTVARLADAMARAEIDVKVPAFDEGGVKGAMWQKFVKICGFSGIGAVTRATAGEWIAQPRTLSLFASLATEAVAVARAHGASQIDEGWLRKHLENVHNLPSGSTASMMRDMMAGKPSELHEQAGSQCTLGPAHRFVRFDLTHPTPHSRPHPYYRLTLRQPRGHIPEPDSLYSAFLALLTPLAVRSATLAQSLTLALPSCLASTWRHS
jgi:2-dehydropantoate 2-reductase